MMTVGSISSISFEICKSFLFDDLRLDVFLICSFQGTSYKHLDIRYLIDLITKFLLSSCDEHPWDSDPSAKTPAPACPLSDYVLLSI